MKRSLFWATAAALVLAAPAIAQEYRDRLSVTVRGHATAPADEVAIELTVSASADDAQDAEKHYRDKLNKVLTALGKGDGAAGDAGEGKKSKKKKKAADDDDADAPKKKGKAADDEDAPKKKGKKGDDEEAPKKDKKGKKASDDDDEEAPPKKSDKKKAADDDDEEDAPKAKKGDKKDSADKGEKKAPDEKKADDKKADEKKAADKGDKGDAKAEEEKYPFVIEVKEGGLTFGLKGGDPNQQRMRRMMNGNQPAKDEPEFRFSSEISVVFKNVAKAEPRALRKRIAEVLDKVSDGADMGLGAEGDGQPPLIRFAVADVEALRNRANEDAIKAARKRGGSLAALSERDLGKVVIVRDQTALPTATRRPPPNPYQYGYNYAQVSPGAGEDWSTEVAVDVDLYVEFELKDKGAAPAPASTPAPGK